MQTRQLSDLEGLAVNTMVDVLAVVVTMSTIQHVTTRAGKETFKQSSIIKDESGCSIELTLWGMHAKTIGEQLEQVISQIATLARLVRRCSFCLCGKRPDPHCNLIIAESAVDREG